MAEKRSCGPCGGSGKQEKHIYGQIQEGKEYVKEVLVKTTEDCWRCEGTGKV